MSDVMCVCNMNVTSPQVSEISSGNEIVSVQAISAQIYRSKRRSKVIDTNVNIHINLVMCVWNMNVISYGLVRYHPETKLLVSMPFFLRDVGKKSRSKVMTFKRHMSHAP